ATALTDALNQFNAPASEAGVFVDALANGAKYGAAEIPQVTDALLKFGSVARSSNISIKESTALVELLAENGLKGADAGTALRNVLLKLSAPDALPRKAQQAIKDLGISFEFLKDKSIPIQQKLEALKPILKDNAKLVEVFGLENTVAAQNIIGHTERLKELTIKMGEVGTAEEQAIKRSNTLEGSFDKLGSAYDSFILSLSDRNSLGTALKFVTDELTSTVEGWRKIFTSNEKLKEEEMAILRKKEIDSILKSYSDTNKYNDGQLILVKKSNSEQIKNNAERVKLLISQNKENFYYTNQEALKQGAFSDKTEKDLISYKKNTAEILRLNKESRTLINKNDGLDNLLNSRKIVKNKNNTPNSNEDSDNDKKAAKAKLDLQKQLNDSLYELQKQRLEQTIKFNEEIVADDSQSDEMRIQATYNSQQKQKDLLLLTKKHLLDNDKLTVNDRIRINEDYSSKLKELKKKSQKEIDKINEFDEASYQKSLEDKISKNNVAMNSELEVENRKFLALGDLEKQSQKDRENAIENHEKTVFDIKKKYAISALKLQISNLETELIASDALPEKEKLSSEKRQKIAETLTKAKLDLSEEELKNNDDKNKKTVDKEKITAEKLLEISQSLTSALSDLANAIFERKITNINEEITKNDEYYAKQIELAGNDQRKKDILQKEAEKKRQVLEKKKREEEHKQAVFNKAVTIAQIAIQTALSVMKGFADSGYVGAILAGVLGAISLATAIATPIPKYKMGRKGGPAEIAMINDGGVQEVVTDASGNNARTTTNKNAIVSLMKGDIVHKSMEDYQKYIRNSILSNVNAQARKTSDFQAKQYFENRHDKEMLEELKKTNKALEKQKTEVNLTNKIDIGHEIWKLGNTNWSK
ncbi:MAG: phage tail tape measure protein, partial [Flavobacterium sp.]|uniref:phage tail tape measure protein n=1 Tax=Flavobacterium sp. TaxID=239 RepID=UPI0032657E8C